MRVKVQEIAAWFISCLLYSSSGFATECAATLTIEPGAPQKIIDCLKEVEAQANTLNEKLNTISGSPSSPTVYAVGYVSNFEEVDLKFGPLMRIHRGDRALYKIDFIDSVDFDPIIVAGAWARSADSWIEVIRTDRAGFEVQGRDATGKPLDAIFWFMVIRPPGP
jgi:hypothetical protein